MSDGTAPWPGTGRLRVFVIGADRGFSTFGYVVFELFEDREVVVEVGVIETKKSAKKTGTLAASDDHRRGQEIVGALTDVFDRYNPVAAAAEATSLPRNSSSAHKIGIGGGVWLTLLCQRDVPLSEGSPQAIKKKLCGKATASKVEIQEEMERRYPGQFDEFKVKYARGKWEHGFDAGAAVVACLDSDVFKMARQLVRR